MKAKALLITLALLSVTGTVWSQESTTVVWTNFSSDGPTQESLLLRDFGGAPLSQGAAGVNSDGRLVQLGYFSMGTITNNFLGTFIPITGFLAATRTSVGDSAGLGGSGAGVISFSSFYALNTTDVQIYSAGDDPGAYTSQSSISITTMAPPNNQVLAIRFFDTNNGQSGFFNTVSSDSATWQWKTPSTEGGGPVVFIDFANTTLEFEDFANPFRTTILVPEPSTYALLMVGLVGAVAARRRFKRPA